MLYKINEPKEPRPSPRVKNLVALSGPKKGKQLKVSKCCWILQIFY